MNKYFLVLVCFVVTFFSLGLSVQASSSDDAALTKMFQAIKDVRALNYNLKLQGTTVNDKNNVNYLVDLNGQIDTSNIASPKSQTSFSLSGNNKSSLGNVAGNNNISIKLDTLSLNNIFYLNLREFNLTVIKAFVGPEGYNQITSYIGKWIKFDPKEIESYFQQQAGTSLTINSYKQQLTKSQSKLEDPVVQAKLRQAFVSSHVLRFTSRSKIKTAEGLSATSYKFTVDKVGLRKLIIATSQIMGTPIDAKNLKKFDTEVKQAYLPSGEIWIGTTDNLPYKLVLNSNINIPASASTKKLAMTYNLTANLKDYNKPVKLVAPSPIQNILDLIKPYLEKAKSTAKEASSLSLLSTTRTLAEIYWGEHQRAYYGFCQDKILSATKEQLQKYSLTLNCRVSPDGQSYFAYLKLASGKINCVDSTGFNGMVRNTPTNQNLCQ